MKKVEWLISLADKRPLLFSVALLLIAVSVLSLVVLNREDKQLNCQEDKAQMQAEYNRRLDSVVARSARRELELNEEVKKSLNQMLESSRKELEEQIKLNEKLESTISENQKLINSRIKKIKN